MEPDKKKIRIFTNNEYLLKGIIIDYNSINKTDFTFVKYVHSEVNFAIIEFDNASFNQIFELGRILGGTIEAVEKNISNPPSTFM
ncbi:hypothetical protein [Flavobacterium collinsii]|uniref:Uncharacterized protein n=1 Tax=Flavobacterium collinsii TaxID=1114861 RepID=A0A9W4X413_9FLAO|nr:hypothetical protein [Flavobacterium collinsii]CAA9203400.1 hypothetical protein FLACOL7796_04726 [Flavobacterium collinsii]CAI2767617.1 conserved protein of unknown function [Flavobacterium collinsii]